MGVRGLHSYLLNKLAGVVCACALPPNSTLAIDGDGWMFQLIEVCFSFRTELGGCYEALDASICAEVQRLRSCGLQLTVFFDGPDRRMKLATTAIREQQRKEQWARFYEYCEENARLLDDDTFPLPSLCYEQLLASLKKCGIPCTFCDGEADQEIAKFVSTSNAGCVTGEERYFAYGRDSDFLVMKGCPYIELGTITAAERGSERSSSGRQSSGKSTPQRQKAPMVAECARVWRRSEVCEALGVSEAAFVHFAIVVGNDYTSSFNRSLVYDWAHLKPDDSHDGPAPGVSNGFGPAALESVLRCVAGLEGPLRASTAVETPEEAAAVQLAIDFSVAVYELQSLEAFPLDDPRSHRARSAELASAEVKHQQRDELALVSKDGFVSPAQVIARFRSCSGSGESAAADHGVPWDPRLDTVVGATDGGDGGDGREMPSFFQDLDAYVAEQVAAAARPPRPRIGIAEHALAYLRRKVAGAAEISGAHVRALEAMLLHVYERPQAAADSAKELQKLAVSSPPPAPSSNCKTKARPASAAAAAVEVLCSETFPFRPRWRDVVAAHAYQTACSLLLRAMPKDAYRGKRNGPCDLYQGVYFHSALRHLAMAATGPAPVTTGLAIALPVSEGLPAPPVLRCAVSSGDGPDAIVPTDAVEAGSPIEPIPAPPLPANPSGRKEVLPIDAYREEILARIQRDRVTIIHGETGCGKSSCLPVFLLEHAEGCSPPQPCQIMVSQPRRIAVTSLLRRLRPMLGNKVGMRMGHGVRDDSPATRIHYVTTGYLVRALAHQPQHFQRVTHLIIDEVHERSVDGDLVCLLARNLLKTHPTLRVVLMSATIHTSLYRDYFARQDDGSYGDMDCLSVGVRRFPVDICYPEDILEAPAKVFGGRSSATAFAPAAQAACRDILERTTLKGSAVPGGVPDKLAVAQYKAAVALVRALCADGTGVLIFVSGINDITELVQLFEPFGKFLVFPIHSDIPGDEQELAFGATPPDKVKVVVATNAAESSVTIPDCDMVICLGTHKALQYSSVSHRTQLVNTWVSKASATQRAGRTGRVRPGRVFRLYSRTLFEALRDHEVAEVHRRPLQDVVLNMWVMLEDAVGFTGVTPFLQGLIEAPDLRNIEQSYQHLYEGDFITNPSDQGFLTATGRLAGELPVDIALGRMIAYGVMLGVAAEVVALAAALTLPKSPFRYANAIYNGPDEYIDIIRAKFLTAAEFDGGAYSEPIALMNLLRKWRSLDARRQATFSSKNGVVAAVMKQFKSMADHLAHTVSARLRPARDGRHVTEDGAISLDKLQPPDADTLHLLRLVLFWSSSGNVLRVKNTAKHRLQDTSALVHSSEVGEAHLQHVFGPRVPYKLQMRGKRVYDARLAYWASDDYFVPLVRVLDGLAAVHEQLTVDAFWVVVKSESNHSTLVALVVPAGDRAEGVLGLLVTHVFQHESRLTSTAGRAVVDALQKHARRLGDAVVLVVSDASKSEVKRLNDFRDMLEGSLSMVVPVVGTAKLTASNCCPSEEALRELFFGQDEPELTGAAGRIACQVTGNRCLVAFPEDTDAIAPHRPLFGEADSDSDEEGHGTEGGPLIDDLPLGHRFLNCCQQQVGRTKAKHLVLGKLRDGPLDSTARAAVPGSLRYAQQHLQQQGAPSASPTAEAVASAAAKEERLEVRVDCVTASWVNVRALKTTPAALSAEDETQLSSIRAILSKQTYLSCSFHRGPESLFAVCHTSLLLGAGEGLAACEGVTFLPPGPNWAYLALLCAGADANQLISLCPDVARELQVTPSQVRAAELVADLMRRATAIVPRLDIADAILAAFYGDEVEDQGDHESGEGYGSSYGESDDDSDSMHELLAGLTLEDGAGDAGGAAAQRRGKARGGDGGPPPEVPVIVQQHRVRLGAADPTAKAATVRSQKGKAGTKGDGQRRAGPEKKGADRKLQAQRQAKGKAGGLSAPLAPAPVPRVPIPSIPSILSTAAQQQQQHPAAGAKEGKSKGKGKGKKVATQLTPAQVLRGPKKATKKA